MKNRGVLWMAATALVALAVACGTESSKTPASPTTASSDSSAASADGSTLKVTAPTLVSPADGTTLDPLTLGSVPQVTVRIQAATGRFVPAEPLTYYYQLLDASGNLLRSNTTTALTSVFTGLEYNKTYKWKVRAEKSPDVGPSSPTWTVIMPDVPTGYIRGNEIYDPLDNGKTVGKIFGAAHFIQGVGLSLDAPDSWVEYTLPTTLTGGEYSLLVTNLSVESNDEDPKYRVMTMRQGWGAMNDNIYRMSVDKRGNGAVAWRFLTGKNSAGGYLESGPSERTVLAMHENLLYLYKSTWGGGRFTVLIKENGFSGKTLYSINRGYSREYNPSPHNVYIGSPYMSGDRGEPSTCENMIVRQVWVSPNPRPSFANK